MITMLNVINIINMTSMTSMIIMTNVTNTTLYTKQDKCNDPLLITMWCDDPKSSDHHLTKIHMIKG